MDLSIYDIIRGPIVTDKAYRLNRELKKLVLKVHPDSNKPIVAQAIERLFNVKVDKVHILIRKGKKRRLRKGKEVCGTLTKKAIVTLAEGYTLDLFDQAGIAAGADAKASTGPKSYKDKE